MNSSKKKLLSLLLSVGCGLSCFSIADCFAEAKEVTHTVIDKVTIDDNSHSSRKRSRHVDSSTSRVFDVYDSRDLAEAVKDAKSSDEIRLHSSIRLHKNLDIDHSLILNLNGHTITTGENGCQIRVGKKVFVRKDKKDVWHEGYYKTVEDNSYTYNSDWKVAHTCRYKQVWVPGHTESVYTDVYSYDENVDVVFKNGCINRLDGLKGADGGEDVGGYRYHGEDGQTPNAPVDIISGILRFKSTTVKGGKGGQGGNGGYESLWHIPLFGGGDAGNGGNGGNGGWALCFDKDHSTYSLDRKSKLVKGEPGRGGKAGKPNPNYWVYSGSKGKNGKDGK